MDAHAKRHLVIKKIEGADFVFVAEFACAQDGKAAEVHFPMHVVVARHQVPGCRDGVIVHDQKEFAPGVPHPAAAGPLLL
jgi:hypothetical protein